MVEAALLANYSSGLCLRSSHSYIGESPEAHARLHHALEFCQRDFRIGALRPEPLRHPRVLQALGIFDLGVGRYSRKLIGTGTSSWASVRETRV